MKGQKMNFFRVEAYFQVYQSAVVMQGEHKLSALYLPTVRFISLSASYQDSLRECGTANAFERVLSMLRRFSNLFPSCQDVEWWSILADVSLDMVRFIEAPLGALWRWNS